jgi:deoxyribodipyrimidine photo-lyase
MEELGHVLGSDREELVAELARAFPEADRGQSHASVVGMSIRGGRQAALERMAAIDPVAYARTRNHVTGAVSGLSPWIRHGVASLAEVRDRALALVGKPDDAAKFVSELGWRDYWRQVHEALGDRIRDSIEPPAALPRAGGKDRVPDDVLAAATGMECIDAFVRRLHDTGWLHNHERMWLASWLVHARGVRWQAGADWFLEHLLDGDPASNHLSWQWVAGTFSAKPYIFNRENLETFTGGVHCSRCPLIGSCDVEGDYDDLAARFFQPEPAAATRQPLRIRPEQPWLPGGGAAAGQRPLVWLTLDSLSAESPAAATHAAAPRVFVIDPAWLAEERPTLKRLAFIFECLADVPDVEVHLGEPAEVLATRARAHGCDHVAVAETPCPRIRRAAESLATRLPVAIVSWPRFCDRSRVKDLGRFSRYWQQVSGSALVPTAKSSGA